MKTLGLGLIRFLRGIQKNHYRYKHNLDASIKFGYPINIRGNVNIGKRTSIGRHSHLITGENSIINIGKDCAISYNVHIRAITHDINNLNKFVEGDIFIGDKVWICANAFIREGVTIEDNSVVGANSVVTNDVTENSIVGGVPAKLIKFKRDDITARAVAHNHTS